MGKGLRVLCPVRCPKALVQGFGVEGWGWGGSTTTTGHRNPHDVNVYGIVAMTGKTNSPSGKPREVVSIRIDPELRAWASENDILLVPLVEKELLRLQGVQRRSVAGRGFKRTKKSPSKSRRG